MMNSVLCESPCVRRPREKCASKCVRSTVFLSAFIHFLWAGSFMHVCAE